jgi:DNA-binding CsgD family transcriptional regulator
MVIPALATAMWATGQLAEAAELLDGAIEAARLSGNDQALAWDLLNRGINAMAAGDLELALAAAREAVDLTRGFAESFVWSYAGVALAIVLMESGEHAQAIELLIRHAGGEELSSIPGVWRTWWLERLTRSLLAIERREAAARAAAEAATIAEATGLRLGVVMAQRAAAAVALDSVDAAQAARLALASSATAGELGMPIEAAASRVLAGRALMSAGDHAGAVAALRRAADEFDACGARRGRGEAERELGRLGQRPYRRSRSGQPDGAGLAALTARELEVAHLIVDRKTNAEIAGALFLSQKTVESHIRNLFRKLDVNSRVDIARAVEHAERH